MNPIMPRRMQNGMTNYTNLKKDNNLSKFVTHTIIVNIYANSTMVH